MNETLDVASSRGYLPHNHDLSPTGSNCFASRDSSVPTGSARDGLAIMFTGDRNSWPHLTIYNWYLGTDLLIAQAICQSSYPQRENDQKAVTVTTDLESC